MTDEKLTLDQIRQLLPPVFELEVVSPPQHMPNDHPAGFQHEAQLVSVKDSGERVRVAECLGQSEWDAAQRMISNALLEWWMLREMVR